MPTAVAVVERHPFAFVLEILDSTHTALGTNQATNSIWIQSGMVMDQSLVGVGVQDQTASETVLQMPCPCRVSSTAAGTWLALLVFVVTAQRQGVLPVEMHADSTCPACWPLLCKAGCAFQRVRRGSVLQPGNGLSVQCLSTAGAFEVIGSGSEDCPDLWLLILQLLPVAVGCTLCWTLCMGGPSLCVGLYSVQDVL